MMKICAKRWKMVWPGMNLGLAPAPSSKQGSDNMPVQTVVGGCPGRRVEENAEMDY